MAKAPRDDGHPRVDGTSEGAWRTWLEANHADATAVWLVYHKKASGIPSITWSQAVDDALCFGWIDSVITPLDEHRYEQYFAPRKPTSTWSQINKDKIEALRAAGRMHPAGEAVVALAQQRGTWTAEDAAHAGIVPGDLAAALDAHPGARDSYESFSPSTRKGILNRVYGAKRPATRAARIDDIAGNAAEGRKPSWL